MTVNNQELLGLKVVTLDITDTINASSGKSQYLTPPEGFIYQIVAIDAKAVSPGGTASGTHFLSILYDDTTDFTRDCSLATVTATHNQTLQIKDFQFIGDSAESPSDMVSQTLAINGGIFATSTNFIKFFYWNGTDVNQTNDVEIEVICKVYKEVFA